MCQLISGQHIDAKDYNTESRGIGYLTGPSDFGPVNPIISKWTEHPKVKAKNGDILITVKGSGVGKINLLDQEEVVISRQLMAVRVKGADPHYIHAFLSSTFDHFQGLSTGAAIPGISREQVLGLEIATPSLPEQQRIVALLDEAFDGIATAKANAERNLKNARELFESHLQSVFTQRGEGWVETTLGEVAQVKGGKRVPKGYKLLSEPTDFPYLRVTDFSDSGTIDMSDLRYVSRDVYQQIKNYIITPSDLYLSIAGTIGKTGIIPAELDGANLTENACRLVFKPGVSNRFVYYFTRTPSFTEQAGLNTRTAAQPKLALSRLSTIQFSLPAQHEQHAIVSRFDALIETVESLEAIYRQKLAALDGLKKSMLHKAFNGEL